MLLVDCYNLLCAAMPPSLAGLDEARLCRLLAAGSDGRGRIVVVCDGAIKPHGPARSPVEAVQLIYAGGSTADEVIIGLIDQSSAPRRLAVVSNDRQIRKAARRRRARAVSCEQMIHQLSRLAAGDPAPAPPSKPTAGSLSDDQVRRWAETFGLDPDAPIDRPSGGATRLDESS